MKKYIATLVLLLILPSAQAGLLYNYSDLALKELDQMAKLVQDKIKESNSSQGDKVIPLKEALQAIYSRPNEDGLIEKVQQPLKSALDDQEAWVPTINQLVKEAIGALKNPKAFKPVVQVTYSIFLENLMSEMKPKSVQEFEKSIMVQIRDANIQLTKEAKNERILRMMKEIKSPTDFANQILNEVSAFEKEKKEHEAMEAKAAAAAEKKK